MQETTDGRAALALDDHAGAGAHDRIWRYGIGPYTSRNAGAILLRQKIRRKRSFAR